ncbi:MAG: DUF1080 domain-containing protein [Bacteroidales bacterium]
MNRSENNKWQSLFNGKDLTGWDTYLGPKYDTVLNRRDSIPIGLNTDPLKVFDVADLGGEKVMRISGEQFGGISTTREFENFHLQLQFKWGKLQWPPNKKGKKDSGLMYYAVGPQGADGGFWLRSHEFQIEEGDCGDYWACAGAIFDVRAKKENDSTYIYNKNGDLFTFSTVSPNGRNCQKYPDAEKPTGEWNTIDLYCYGGTSVHIVNGVVNMVLQNSRQLNGNKEIPLTKGKIQFESEGAEIFYRNIKICSIDKLPDNIMNDKHLAN